MKREKKKQIMSAIILLVFSGSILTYAIMFAFPEEEKEGVWKVGLLIYIYGEPIQIPAGIGVFNETKSKLYTLSNDNIIYKKGSEEATLGEFFKIWGKEFNRTCILDYCNNENHSMRMYVRKNGKWVENFDYDSYVLKNGDVILIDYR